MSSFDRDQGDLVLTPGELEALGDLAGGRDVQPEFLSALRNIGMLDRADQPAADIKQVATVVATAETRYSYTSVEAGSVRGYRMWVSEDAMVGHHLPSSDTPGVPTAGPVLFAPRDRLPVVLLTLADIPPRGSEPSEIPAMDGRALWAWLRDDRILAPDCELLASRLFRTTRRRRGHVDLLAGLVFDKRVVTRLTTQGPSGLAKVEKVPSLVMVFDLLNLAAREHDEGCPAADVMVSASVEAAR